MCDNVVLRPTESRRTSLYKTGTCACFGQEQVEIQYLSERRTKKNQKTVDNDSLTVVILHTADRCDYTPHKASVKAVDTR